MTHRRAITAPFEVLSFDCYGTLIDWEEGIWQASQPLIGGRAIERADLLARFAEIESATEAAQPTMVYTDLLGRVHDEMAASLGLPTTPELDAAFGCSVVDWPPFADSAGALRRLASRFRLVILSNADRAGFAGSNRHLGVEFDAILTAEDIGSYKPDPANFRTLIDTVAQRWELQPNSILHVAQSLFHDIVPAHAAGLTTAWIDRQGLARGGAWGATAVVDDPPTPDHRFESLTELAEALGV